MATLLANSRKPRFRFASSRSFLALWQWLRYLRTQENLDFASLLLGHFLHSNEQKRIKKSPRMQAFWAFCIRFCSQVTAYLFENCGALRAALSPYFLRSFIRGSRVKYPAFLSVGLNSPST